MVAMKLVRVRILALLLVMHTTNSLGEVDDIARLTELANAGRSDAAYRLGYIYWHGGSGVTANPELSAKFLRMAVRTGDRDALYALSLALLESKDGDDQKEGEEALMGLAQGGYPGAALALANRHMFSQTSVDRKVNAKKWYVRAAYLGNPVAYYNAGILYLDPQAGEISPSIALSFLEKGFDLGCSECAFVIGNMYMSDIYGKKDSVIANEWYERAALLGNKDAQYNLSLAYFSGDGVRHDPVASYRWAYKASVQGQQDAEQLMALLCKDAPLFCAEGDE